ncbi:hypothetical protein DL769_007074 [Monosporascus sp. CRB-8-3]|nr:hypothetical protein DL769_007074 [Monosporascus sp. CRB-8-3]
MEDGFQEWQEDFNPFDAIGFPAIGFQPPARDDFYKAVRYARFATQPERLRQAAAAAPKLPYTWEQVELAVDFFTGVKQNGAGRERQNGPDTVVWQWTFYDIIEFQCHSRYRRTWAPERRRWDQMILDPPVVIVVVPSPMGQQDYHHDGAVSSQTQQPQQQTQQSLLPPTYSSPSSCRTSLGSATATAATTPDSDRCIWIPPPPDDDDSVQESPSATTVKRRKKEVSPPDDDDNVQESTSATTVKRRKKEADTRRIISQPLRAGTFVAGKSIFMGWHTRQLDLAAENTTPDRDYRQAVFATVTTIGHIFFRLRSHNVLGQLVPAEYRLKGLTTISHKEVVYRPIFAGMLYDEVRLEIGRQTLRQESWQSDTAWIPTLFVHESGRVSDVPVKRPKGRPWGRPDRKRW